MSSGGSDAPMVTVPKGSRRGRGQGGGSPARPGSEGSEGEGGITGGGEGGGGWGGGGPARPDPGPRGGARVGTGTGTALGHCGTARQSLTQSKSSAHWQRILHSTFDMRSPEHMTAAARFLPLDFPPQGVMLVLIFSYTYITKRHLFAMIY